MVPYFERVCVCIALLGSCREQDQRATQCIVEPDWQPIEVAWYVKGHTIHWISVKLKWMY